MRTLYSSLLLLSLFSLASCHHPCDEGSDDPPAKTGKVLFEVSFTNYAWGYDHQGMYIDNEGRIYRYTWPRDGAKWEHKGDVYTEAELMENYAPGSASAGTISRDSLNMMIGLMESASRGTFSDTTLTAADGGVTHISLYRYDKSTNTYHQVALRQRGDFSFDNLSSSARQLADILETRWNRFWQ